MTGGELTVAVEMRNPDNPTLDEALVLLQLSKKLVGDSESDCRHTSVLLCVGNHTWVFPDSSHSCLWVRCGLVQDDPFPLVIERHIWSLARGDTEHAEPAADVIPSERCNALRPRIGVGNALRGAPVFGFFP